MTRAKRTVRRRFLSAADSTTISYLDLPGDAWVAVLRDALGLSPR